MPVTAVPAGDTAGGDRQGDAHGSGPGNARDSRPGDPHDNQPGNARDSRPGDPRNGTLGDAAVVDAARLRLVIGRLSRRLRRHQLAGLTPGQVGALSTVDRCGPLRLSELAAIEGIAPSTLTRLVAALEEQDYVRRCPVAGDARASELAITPAGRDVLERIRRESTAALAGSLASLQPGQLATLAAALPVMEQLADGIATDGRTR
jgi:DNA-binding MarR family transcriptional regulator